MIWYQERQNKYRAKTSIYDGVAYHSKKEAAFAQELDLRKKAGEIKDWRRQVRIPLDVNGQHICDYYIDFEIEHNDGSKEMIEVKGFQTEVWRLKWKLFEAIYNKEHPDIKLTVIL